jgi:hypothetical protein
MGLGLRTAPRLAMVQNCEYCTGKVDDHAPGCPAARLDYLVTQKKQILCPNCKAPAVDVNTSDFYECRSCHTQYTRAQIDNVGGGTELVSLLIDEDAPLSEGMKTVRVLNQKGSGSFAIDNEIIEIRKKYDL